MKTFSIISLLALAALCILESSCKKDQADVKPDPYKQLCTPVSNFYFRGTINDIDKCWNIGERNYQYYVGGGAEITENERHDFWMQGLDQYPIPESSEAIFIRSESIYPDNKCTRQQFFDSFIPGTIPIIPINSAGTSGVEIIYTVNGTSYSSRSGLQDGNKVELMEAIKNSNVENSDQIILKYRFACNLYSCSGSFYGKISMGELRTIQIRAN